MRGSNEYRILVWGRIAVQGAGKQQVACAAPYPGKILAMDLEQLGGHLVCQKDSFLCAARGVSIGIAFQRRIGVGLFGGEGLFFATLRGPGRVWLESLPFSRMADRIYKAAPAAGGRRREQGSILGGLGDLMDGDS
ncbi:MAG: AIM24 family protein [Acidobacteria bacterium]|nr:AIM24 family protein [Acidobacteriota bacterium]